MLKFIDKCSKCLSKELKRQYKKDDNGIGGEFLEVTCQNCSYVFQEKCADSK